MKTLLASSNQVSRHGYSVAYSINGTSPNTLIFRVHECPRPLRKNWGIK